MGTHPNRTDQVPEAKSVRSGSNRYCILLLVCTFALIVLSLFFRAFTPRIEPKYCGNAFTRIELGMSQQDVESVFGKPEGNYNAGPFVGPTCGVGLPSKSDAVKPSVRWLSWTYDDAEIVVGLDVDGQVVTAHSAPNVYRPTSFFEELQGFFKRVF
jgi:hypothetical protein